MQSGNKVVGPFVALFLALAVGWLMQPSDSPPLPLPTRPMPAPDWILTDFEGKPHQLSEYRGKVVVLNFWATFCPPCIREIPDLSRFHTDHEAEGIVVVGISGEADARELVPAFVKSHRVPYPVLLVNPVDMESFGASTIPQTFVIDTQGMVRNRFLGRMRIPDLERAVAAVRPPVGLTNPTPGTGSVVR